MEKEGYTLLRYRFGQNKNSGIGRSNPGAVAAQLLRYGLPQIALGLVGRASQ